MVIYITIYSSNINEVIKTVLNLLFFFFKKRFHTHKKAQKVQKAPKAQKAQKLQKSNQGKAQKRK